jgi:Na+-translocating ferredoxin:NAD+ oxidoreductase subunit A
MSNLLILLVSAVLVNSIALRAPGTAVLSDRSIFRVAVLLGTTTVVLTALSSALAWMVQQTQSLAPIDLLVLAFVASVLAYIADRYLRSRDADYALAPAITVVLLASNSISFGAAVLRTTYVSEFTATLLAGIGGGIVFGLLLLAFESLRERVEQADVPIVFRAIPVQLIVAGCISLALMGLVGLTRS